MIESLGHFDPGLFTALNQEFHATLFSKCTNPRMVTLVEAEWARLGTCAPRRSPSCPAGTGVGP